MGFCLESHRPPKWRQKEAGASSRHVSASAQKGPPHFLSHLIGQTQSYGPTLTPCKAVEAPREPQDEGEQGLASTDDDSHRALIEKTVIDKKESFWGITGDDTE